MFLLPYFPVAVRSQFLFLFFHLVESVTIHVVILYPLKSCKTFKNPVAYCFLSFLHPSELKLLCTFIVVFKKGMFDMPH